MPYIPLKLQSTDLKSFRLWSCPADTSLQEMVAHKHGLRDSIACRLLYSEIIYSRSIFFNLTKCTVTHIEVLVRVSILSFVVKLIFWPFWWLLGSKLVRMRFLQITFWGQLQFSSKIVFISKIDITLLWWDLTRRKFLPKSCQTLLMVAQNSKYVVSYRTKIRPAEPIWCWAPTGFCWAYFGSIRHKIFWVLGYH